MARNTYRRAGRTGGAQRGTVLGQECAYQELPGTITVSIGAPIDPTGMEPGDLNASVESWIEAEMARIDDPTSGNRESGR